MKTNIVLLLTLLIATSMTANDTISDENIEIITAINNTLVDETDKFRQNPADYYQSKIPSFLLEMTRFAASRCTEPYALLMYDDAERIIRTFQRDIINWPTTGLPPYTEELDTLKYVFTLPTHPDIEKAIEDAQLRINARKEAISEMKSNV